MPSLREIAVHIGVSKARAGQLKMEGMPVTSLAAAKMWRSRQTLQRAPTNAKGNCKFDVAKLGRGRRLRSRAVPSNTGNSLEDARCDAITMNKCAFALFEAAKATGNDELLPRYIRIFMVSHQLRMKAERMAREEAQRRGVLVNYHAIMAKVRRCLDTVLKRLRRLPQESGPQCNPHDPVRAYEILQRAVDEILLTDNRPWWTLRNASRRAVECLSIPPRPEEAPWLPFGGIEADDHTAIADDGGLHRRPVRHIGGGFDSVADARSRVKSVFHRL